MVGGAVIAMPRDDATGSCQVLLDDMHIMADIGAFAHEAGVPQPLHIHVAVDIVPPRADDLSQTLDYTAIRTFALELAAERVVLIETFARKLAQRCLAHDAALAADVRIAKPRAIAGCLAGARVVLVKRRADADAPT